jgi:hypothetical protein
VFLLYSWSFLLYSWSFILYSWSFLLYSWLFLHLQTVLNICNQNLQSIYWKLILCVLRLFEESLLHFQPAVKRICKILMLLWRVLWIHGVKRRHSLANFCFQSGSIYFWVSSTCILHLPRDASANTVLCSTNLFTLGFMINILYSEAFISLFFIQSLYLAQHVVLVSSFGSRTCVY